MGYSYFTGPPFAQGWLWRSGNFTALTDTSLPLPYGINNNGQLVGIYAAKPSGFLATPAGQTSLLYPMIPCRVVDTRNPNGDFGGPPITGGTSRSFTIPSGPCGQIPSFATAYSLNVTLVPISGERVRYLTIWPTGQSQPVVSTMNSDGRVKANAAIVPAGTDGAVSVYVTDTTNVIIDIDGFFISSDFGVGLKFYPLTPCRVVDTRSNQFPEGLGQPHLYGGQPRDLPIPLSSCIPSDTYAVAYSFNLTAIPYLGKPMGYLEIYPTGLPPDNPVSTLNNPNGINVANAAIATAINGQVTVYPSADTDLAIDVNGYFLEPGNFKPGGATGLSLYPVTPCRVLDTRSNNGQPFSGVLPPVDVINSGCRDSGRGAGLRVQRHGNPATNSRISDAVAHRPRPAHRVDAECTRRRGDIEHGDRAELRRFGQRLRAGNDAAHPRHLQLLRAVDEPHEVDPVERLTTPGQARSRPNLGHHAPLLPHTSPGNGSWTAARLRSAGSYRHTVFTSIGFRKPAC